MLFRMGVGSDVAPRVQRLCTELSATTRQLVQPPRGSSLSAGSAAGGASRMRMSRASARTIVSVGAANEAA
jgi:hypothetical protein